MRAFSEVEISRLEVSIVQVRVEAYVSRRWFQSEQISQASQEGEVEEAREEEGDLTLEVVEALAHRHMLVVEGKW